LKLFLTQIEPPIGRQRKQSDRRLPLRRAARV
jgi:hypothetical protein